MPIPNLRINDIKDRVSRTLQSQTVSLCSMRDQAIEKKAEMVEDQYKRCLIWSLFLLETNQV